MIVRGYIDARPLQAIAKRFLTAAGKARKTRGLAQRIARECLKMAQNRFEHTKMDPWGEPWLPWSEKYARTRGSNNSLLRDSDDLLNSLTARATDRNAIVETKDPKAGFVQALRPFIGVGPGEKWAVEAAATDWLERLL